MHPNTALQLYRGTSYLSKGAANTDENASFYVNHDMWHACTAFGITD